MIPMILIPPEAETEPTKSAARPNIATFDVVDLKYSSNYPSSYNVRHLSTFNLSIIGRENGL